MNRRAHVKRAKLLWGYHGSMWQGSGAAPRQKSKWRKKGALSMAPKKTRKAEALACAIRGGYRP